MTQFLVDEGCDAIVVRTLRKLNYDVLYVAEISPGKDDQDILTLGYQDQRIIITEDRDFCELVFRDNKPTFGIVLIRISDLNRLDKAVQITTLVNNHLEQLPGAMTTIKVNTIKIRPIGP